MSRTAGLVSSKSLRFFQSIRDGHVVGGRLSHVGPFHHNSNKMRCFGDVPLEAMSDITTLACSLIVRDKLTH